MKFNSIMRLNQYGNIIDSTTTKVKKISIELNNIDALDKKYNNLDYEVSLTHTMLPKGYGYYQKCMHLIFQ